MWSFRNFTRTHTKFSIFPCYFNNDRHLNTSTWPKVVNLSKAFNSFEKYWNPQKIRGDFIFHHHEEEDELFFVQKGEFTMRTRRRGPDAHLHPEPSTDARVNSPGYEYSEVTVNEGEYIVIPKGVDHCPIAEHECHILLLEPQGTINTGNTAGSDSDGGLTVHKLNKIA